LFGDTCLQAQHHAGESLNVFDHLASLLGCFCGFNKNSRALGCVCPARHQISASSSQNLVQEKPETLQSQGPGCKNHLQEKEMLLEFEATL
jgi:hypothetical protein